MKTKRPLIIAISILVIIVIYSVNHFLLNSYSSNDKQNYPSNYKSIEYVIDGRPIKLVNGIAEDEIVPNSSVKMITRYFGNELRTDLNGDGLEDIAFLVTQESGGSGTFFYVVAAIKTDQGYVGSHDYLLGDRIAPQNINVSNNPRHKNVIVVNYADRLSGEPMTARPSLGKSVYLKLDPKTLQWGIVVNDFEGEVSL